MNAETDRMVAIDALVTCNHILSNEGIFDDGYGHVSIRDPDNADRFLMAPAIAPAVVTAADIMEYGLDGEPLDRRDREIYAERFIHSEIYAARPDVNAVVHSHAPAVLPFGVVDVPLRPIYHTAHFLSAGAPIFDLSVAEEEPTNLLITNPDRGRALVGSLGEKSVVLMRGHGYTAVGPTLEMVTQRAIITVINARAQTSALSIAEGRPITYLAPEEAALMGGFSTGKGARRTWNMWLSKLGSK